MTHTPSKFVRTTGKLSLLTLALMAAPFAMAQDAGWYGGANVGRTQASIDDARITSGLLGSGLTTTSIEDNDRDRGYKLFGGYQYNKNFAVEAGYFDLGRFGFVANTTPADHREVFCLWPPRRHLCAHQRRLCRHWRCQCAQPQPE